MLESNYGFKVDKVLNPATPNDIFDALQKYIDRDDFKENDQLFIFLAGHGQFQGDVRQRKGVGYFAAKNSARDDKYHLSYIPFSVIIDKISTIRCKHIFVIVDSCFSGAITDATAREIPGELSDPEYVADKLRLPTRLVLTSAGLSYVSDGVACEHSPFAYKVIESLRRFGREDHILTVGELRLDTDRLEQRPQLGAFKGDEPGSDFIFIKRPFKARPTPPDGDPCPCKKDDAEQ